MFPEALNTIKSSYELFSRLQTKSADSSQIPPRVAENEYFDKTFQGMFIHKPMYKQCTFKESKFERPAGESSCFDTCRFLDCEFFNADFRYCDIENSWFVSERNSTIISNSNFSFGTFFNTYFINAYIKGTPLREMVIDGCVFESCIFESFGFERSNIKNSSFKNIDMSKIVFRFCNFENVTFENVTIHILDLAKNFGLINELLLHGKNIKIFFGQGNIISLNEALSMLPKLCEYYMNERDYYYVINILALENKFDKLWSILPEAFGYALAIKDFSSLQDLCNLIVKLNIFSQFQYKELYNIITNKSRPNNLSNHQVRSYTYYLDNIKRILLENPNEYPTAIITFHTNIIPKSMEDLMPLLECIEYNIHRLQSNIIPKIEITHHSPYEVVVYICESLPTLLMACQVFYYAFGGMKSLKDISSSRHEKSPNRQKKNSERTNKKKEISLKIGDFEFRYTNECKNHVEDIEYLIN